MLEKTITGAGTPMGLTNISPQSHCKSLVANFAVVEQDFESRAVWEQR